MEFFITTRYTGHSGPILDVQFSRTGSLIASSARDSTVRLWVPDLKGDSTELKAAAGQAAVRSVQFSPDNQKLLTASDDKAVKVWAVQRTKFISSLTEHTNWVRCARWSPDGRLIASCSDDRTVKVWDVSSGTCIHTFQEPKGFGNQVNNQQWHFLQTNNLEF